MDKRVKFDVFQGGKNIDITMFQYGWEQCLPMHSYGPAKRNHYLFHYVLSGKGFLSSNNTAGETKLYKLEACQGFLICKGFLSSNNTAGETKLYKLEACQGFLICPGQVNTYYADDKKPWEYAWVEFDGLKAVEFMRQSGVDFDHPVYRLKKRELHVYIKSEIMQLVDNPYNSDVNQIGHLYLFFDGLIRGGGAIAKGSQSSGKLRDAYVREAISFIEQNYGDDITVEDIADYCSLNRNYLGKLFKENTNQTLQHFLIYYRMTKASEYLKYSDMTVGEIGKMCGYQNQLHFSRAFKNIYGVSPNHWREKNKLV